MAKQKLLDKIAKEIENCKICKTNKFGKAVPGEGNPNAKIMFVGEAPGKTESETGRPFVGRSGKFLTTLIESAGLKREDVYITSPVKYFPGYRAPTDTEITHGKIHFDKQVKIISPQFIVLLGRVAQKAVLGKAFLLKDLHGKIIKDGKRSYFLTYHPAAALRFPKLKILLSGDFKKMTKELKTRNDLA